MFLVKPEGIQIHELTAGPLDRSDLAVDNARPIAGAKPIALVARDWNRVRLGLAQAKLTIAVNGQEVAVQPLDPAQSRVFGLFHYRDCSEARVRNVTYRGNWPTQVPPVAEQELATARDAPAAKAK